MRHPGDRRSGMADGGRHGCHDDAMLREADVGKTEGPALRREEPAEIELLGRARARLRMLVGLGVDANVGEEPVEERGHGTASGGTAGGATDRENVARRPPFLPWPQSPFPHRTGERFAGRLVAWNGFW